MAIVDPAAVVTGAPEPAVLVEAFHLQGRSVPFRAGVDVSPQENSFEIRYTAPSFVRPDHVRFRYRLSGLDDEWVDAGSRRAAAYYRVPPGRYRFEVMSASNGREGLLLKDATPDEIVRCVREVAAGRNVAGPIGSACSQLDDVQLEGTQKVLDDSLTPDEGAALIDAATSIRTALGC